MRPSELLDIRLRVLSWSRCYAEVLELMRAMYHKVTPMPSRTAFRLSLEVP
jgi:hypothetical protein